MNRRRGAALKPTKTELGRFVRAQRLKLGLTQDDVGKGSRTSQNLISQIEDGIRTILKDSQAEGIARVLGCGLHELRARLPAKPPEPLPTTELGLLIRARREALGLSIEQFAKKMKMDVSETRAFELRKSPTIHYGSVRPLAAALSMEVALIAPFSGHQKSRAKGELGTLVRTRRKELCLNPGKLAKKVGVSRQMIDQIELGRVSLVNSDPLVKKLARALKIEVGELEAVRPKTKPANGHTETLGAFLLSKRKKLRLTQKQLSELSGLSVGIISPVESGDYRHRLSGRSLKKWRKGLNNCRIPENLISPA
jgi:transcriptional regulator with XRE-family HTH domain